MSLHVFLLWSPRCVQYTPSSWTFWFLWDDHTETHLTLKSHNIIHLCVNLLAVTCAGVFLSYVYKHSRIHLHDPHTRQRRAVRHTAKSASSGKNSICSSLDTNSTQTLPFNFIAGLRLLFRWIVWVWSDYWGTGLPPCASFHTDNGIACSVLHSPVMNWFFRCSTRKNMLA